MHLSMICASAPSIKAFFGVYVAAPILKASKNSSGMQSRSLADNQRQVNIETSDKGTQGLDSIETMYTGKWDD